MEETLKYINVQYSEYSDRWEIVKFFKNAHGLVRFETEVRATQKAAIARAMELQTVEEVGLYVYDKNGDYAYQV